MTSFEVSPEDAQKILAAVARVETALELDGPRKLTVVMSLTACHANGCPLDLDAFQTCRFADALHDVAGIDRFVSRRTGKIDPAKFWPRLSLKTT